jgi:hypothetical protein
MDFHQYRCADCGGFEAYRSRPRTFIEKHILPFMLLRPVRCANCFRRTNVSVFTPVHERREKPAFKPRKTA